MSPLLGPLFAQLVTLGIGDRTEARWLKYDTEYFEGSTSPAVGLEVIAGRADFSAAYAPSLTLTPLESKPRELLVFHEASAQTGYRWRRTTLTLSSSIGWGKVNFRLAPLQGPGATVLEDSTPGTADGTDSTDGTAAPADQPEPGSSGAPATPQPGTTAPSDQLVLVDRIVRYYSSSTTLGLGHEPLKKLKLTADLGYTRAGGLNERSRVYYPDLEGWSLGGAAAYPYTLSARDALVGTLSLVKNWSSNGNEAATLNARESWQHTFDRRTASSLGAGITVTRFSQEDGLRGFSVFPNFEASLSHRLPLFRGTLSATAYAYSAPALDPLRALVDPRVGFGGDLSYERKRLSISLNGSTALSLAPEDHDAGAIDSAQAEGVIAYRIAEPVSVDMGARYVRQAVQGVTVLPPSYAAFVGLDLGYALRLAGNKQP